MNSQFLGLFTRKPACAFKNLECYLADQLNIHVFYFTCLSDDLWLSLGVQVEQSAFQTRVLPASARPPRVCWASHEGSILFYVWTFGEKAGGIELCGWWNGFRCVVSHTTILHRWTILLAHFLRNVFAGYSWVKPNTNFKLYHIQPLT